MRTVQRRERMRKKRAESAATEGLPTIETGIPPRACGLRSVFPGFRNVHDFVKTVPVGGSFWTGHRKTTSGAGSALRDSKARGLAFTTALETKEGVAGVRIWRTK